MRRVPARDALPRRAPRIVRADAGRGKIGREIGCDPPDAVAAHPATRGRRKPRIPMPTIRDRWNAVAGLRRTGASTNVERVPLHPSASMSDAAPDLPTGRIGPAPAPRRPRPRLLPPAPTWPASESEVIPPGESLLDLLLWQRARDVRLWASLPKSSRRGMFRRTNAADWELAALQLPEAQPLREPLEMLLAMVRFPDLVEPQSVAKACELIVQHLLLRHQRAAYSWTLAWAHAVPSDPRSALMAGRVSRQLTHLADSLTWFEHAIKRSRALRSPEVLCSAVIGKALAEAEWNQLLRARRGLFTAVAIAERLGSRGLVADAHHELAGLSIFTPDGDIPAHHLIETGHAAHRNYTTIGFAHDLALFHVVHGSASTASELLLALEPHTSNYERSHVIHATHSLVAARTGNRSLYENLMRSALVQATPESSVAALMFLVQAATILGDVEGKQRFTTVLFKRPIPSWARTYWGEIHTNARRPIISQGYRHGRDFQISRLTKLTLRHLSDKAIRSGNHPLST